MKKLKPLVYKYGYQVLRLYWYIRRPQTQGVRTLILCGDQILLIKHTYGSMLWTTPGGGIKRGEDLKQTVRREVQEEVGLELSTVTKVGEVQHEKEFKRDTIHVFLSRTQQTDLQIDQAEIAEARWFIITQLPDDISPLFKQFVALAKSHIDAR